MKIVFLTRLFFPHIGGVEKHVLEVSKILTKKGNEVVIFSELYDSKFPRIESVGRVKVIRLISYGNKLTKKLRIWIELLRHVNILLSANVVHAHDVYFWYLPFRFLFFWKRSFITFHGYETFFPPEQTAILQRRLYNFLSVGSIAVGEFIQKWYGTKTDIVTYGGVRSIQNLKFTSMGVRTKKATSLNSKITILFVGRLEKDTGVLSYIEILKLLKHRGLSFVFEAIGDGSLRKEVEKYGKVHGFVDNVDTYIKKADLVFASSFLSMFDALACKKLVVAVYDNKLKEDYIKMSPFKKYIVVTNNTESGANQIFNYLKHPSSQTKMVIDGYNWIRKQTWKSVVNQYLKLWQK